MNYYHAKLLQKINLQNNMQYIPPFKEKGQTKVFYAFNMHAACEKNNICIKYLWKKRLETNNI